MIPVPFRTALLAALVLSAPPASASPALQAGAAQVDISPPVLPVIRNGGFLEATSDEVADPLHSRAIVLHEQSSDTRVAIAVVDSCMIPRTMCDAIKQDVSARTGIARDHILIAATHTHSAPSVMHYCLGSRADPAYAEFLPPKVTESIVRANEAMQPAQAGWAVFDASAFTATRRWLTRSDRIGLDPFGERTVHAMMHPGYRNADYIGESGPPDPGFSLLSLQSRDGKPLALMGNFSMHYFGAGAGISPDYFGVFASAIAQQLAPGDPDFVGILSQGTSGDSWRADYSQSAAPDPSPTMQQYTSELVALAVDALQHVEHRHDLPLAMAEVRLTLGRRTPDAQRLAWAREKVAAMGERRPRDRPEVYAEQAIYLHENPREEVVLQALRLGDLALTAMPAEVYALTGLKLKARSPFGTTINLSLANGAAGYIPPPEQHHLGGYNTWPARTAGLEVQAEPKMTEGVLRLLEQVGNQPRKRYREPSGAYARTIAAQHPLVHLRMANMEAAPNHEPGLAYHLPGVTGAGFPGPHESRSMAFAGGRLRLDPSRLGDSYSLSLWVWNGMPTDARPVTAYLFSRGGDRARATPGDHLGIGGTHANQGALIFFNGDERNELLAGQTPLPLRTWSHVVLVRDGDNASLYLNGALEASGPLVATHRPDFPLFLGGRSDNFANLEGRLDEVALFPRALTTAEIRDQFTAAGLDQSND